MLRKFAPCWRPPSSQAGSSEGESSVNGASELDTRGSLAVGSPTGCPTLKLQIRKCLEAFGIELAEMKGAQCCPEPYAVLGLGRDAWFALAGRNLTIAEEMKQDILTPCPGCYNTLRTAQS